ncbi:MAG: mycofactocin-associated electron transfer flavoprotein beta subunit [Ilumatobacteraceae bacterium]
MNVLVCWKWVALDDDERWAGVSAADEAALEVALTLASGAGDDAAVTVAAVGPAAAEASLRDAVARGASRAVRIDSPRGLHSEAVAAALAPFAAGCSWVLCGDYSLDRGSGSVPALVAAHRGVAQALGLVDVDAGTDGPLRVVRRLDGGRREELSVASPAVLSVEGSVARLRRASLTAELAARAASIEVVDGPAGPVETPIEQGPYRPRARALPPPSGDDALTRIRALTSSGVEATHGDAVTLDPPQAAARIVQALQEWGYLPAELRR